MKKSNLLATIVNRKTGERLTWESYPYGIKKWNDAEGMKALRGIIRDWCSQSDMTVHDFDVIQWRNIHTYQYLREYAWQHMYSRCDICNTKRKNMDLNWIDDSEEVCLAVVCKNQEECHTVHTDLMSWEPQNRMNYEDDELPELTDEDIADFTGNYFKWNHNM